MNPVQLAAQCVKSMNFWKGEPEKAIVTLTFPKGWKAPPKFPRRELLCDNGKSKVYAVSAMNVLAWLAANNLIKVEARVENAANSTPD